jgi:hypothetical protein
MTRPTRHILVVLLLASLALLWADAWAQPAPPASAPTGAQPCGVGGTALRVGQGPVTLTDLQATEQRVRIGADGYWWTCDDRPAITPGTACGAPGVGVAHGGNYRVARHEPGWRVDDSGHWTECDRPCVPPGATASDYRTWSVGPHRCTTRIRSGVGRRDETIRHGEATTWRQWTGSMRGELIERCDDGVRSVVAVTCAPARQCDTSWSSDGYTYDGRVAPVALGEYAQALAADGTTRRLRCVAGSWVEAPQCAAGQTVVRHYSTEVRRYRYDGAGADPGAKVRAEQIEVRRRDGAVVTDPASWRNSIRWTLATCGPDGRLR